MVPVREFYQKEWTKDQTKEQWVAALRDLDLTHVTWKAPWMDQGCVLYECGDKIRVPLLGLWRVVSYAPLLVCRQYASEQFIWLLKDLISWNSPIKILDMRLNSQNCQHFRANLNEHI